MSYFFGVMARRYTCSYRPRNNIGAAYNQSDRAFTSRVIQAKMMIFNFIGSQEYGQLAMPDVQPRPLRLTWIYNKDRTRLSSIDHVFPR